MAYQTQVSKTVEIHLEEIPFVDWPEDAQARAYAILASNPRLAWKMKNAPEADRLGIIARAVEASQEADKFWQDWLKR